MFGGGGFGGGGNGFPGGQQQRRQRQQHQQPAGMYQGDANIKNLDAASFPGSQEPWVWLIEVGFC
jgi:hypothetical protein